MTWNFEVLLLRFEERVGELWKGVAARFDRCSSSIFPVHLEPLLYLLRMEKDPGLYRMEESFVQLESKTSKQADSHRAHAARSKKKLPNKGEMKSEPNLCSREAVVSPPSLSASDGSKNSDTQAQQPPQGSLHSSEEVGKTWSFRLTTSRVCILYHLRI